MNVIIVGDSIKQYMPYVNTYIDIISDENNLVILEWDRNNDLGKNQFVYKDKKRRHKRSLIDYYRYVLFVKSHLKLNRYDMVIVCGIPVFLLLNKYLYRNYKNKYILDIRDYHKSIKFIDIKKTLKNGYLTVISSPGFKKWLPNSPKMIINHNFQNKLLYPTNEKLEFSLKSKPTAISYIGVVRDLDVNLRLIESLNNNPNYVLNYHGDNPNFFEMNRLVSKLESYNVFITGRYTQNNEYDFYKNSDLINILLSDDINSITLLPNRLYNAVYYCKPVITFSNSYVGDIVETYNLGLIISSFVDIDKQISTYIAFFDSKVYLEGRLRFLKKVHMENAFFQDTIKNYFLK